MLPSFLLDQSISTLSDDPFLLRFVRRHNLNTLRQLLRYSGAELLRMEEGSEHCLLAVYSLLQQHQCTYLWREEGQKATT